jgi:hypothetical protein
MKLFKEFLIMLLYITPVYFLRRHGDSILISFELIPSLVSAGKYCTESVNST